ncbi:MAG TPA: rod shape-determining protein RodA [Bacteroidales bacterium]|nr:rod shape-determining protein RodA [Bacteroidales bacterium]
MRERKSIFHNLDWYLVGFYLLFVFMGLISIYAAVYNPESPSILDRSQLYGIQFVWIMSSLLLATIILMLDVKIFSSFSYLIYGVSMLMLILVLLFGKVISGSKSWFHIGGASLQPAEFAKFATNLALASFLSNLDNNLKTAKTVFIAGFILLIPTALILLQNDTGSAIVYVSFILVLYREGFSGNFLILGFVTAILFVFTLMVGKYLVLGIIAAITIVLFLITQKARKNLFTLFGLFAVIVAFVFSVDYAFENILQDHQKERIEILLGKKTDLKGAGYNVHQSLIAIGSGGFAGKGFLQGTQTKYKFVPEQSTDFIFCTVGEEWGFLGSSLFVFLYLGFLVRLLYAAERQRSAFSRIYGYGVASILFFHMAVNVGMTIGLAPVIGIPLPFFSYGGSSLWAFTILLFIFIKMDSYRLELL